MGDDNLEWKEDRIGNLKESLAFFSNKEKLNREKWVVRRLLRSLQIDFMHEEITGVEEPADVLFQDARFQIKEVLGKNRRRTDEYKAKLEKTRKAKNSRDLLEHYTPKDITF